MMLRLVRAVFVATIVLMLPVSALAQQIGVKAGINFASLTPEEDETPDTSRRLGFVGGAWVSMPLAQHFSFQAEGQFTEKGVKFDLTELLGQDASAEVRLRYIEVPLLARGDFGASGSTARFFVVAGVAPAFKVSAQGKAKAEGQEDTQDLDDDVESFDLGLVGGAGVEFGRFVIEGRYTHGLTHLNTDDNGDEDRIKNRVVSVTFGFRLR